MKNTIMNVYVITDNEGNYMVDSDFGMEFDKGIHEDTLLFLNEEQAINEASGLNVLCIEVPESYRKTHFFI